MFGEFGLLLYLMGFGLGMRCAREAFLCTPVLNTYGYSFANAILNIMTMFQSAFP